MLGKSKERKMTRPDLDFEDTFIGRESTKRSQLSLWRNNIKPFTNVPDYQLNEMFIRSMMNKWTRHSPGTQKLLISITKRYVQFKTGKDINCTSLSRIAGRSKPEVEKTILSKEETKDLLNSAWHLNKSLYQILVVGFNTGCRISELLALTQSDIDYQNKIINVTWSKNGKARKVPMNKKVEEVVSGLPNKLFSYNPNNQLKTLCKITGIKRITNHTMRHTFITRALEAGVSPKIVAKIVGHKNVSTTLNTYWALTKQPDVSDLKFLEDQ